MSTDGVTGHLNNARAILWHAVERLEQVIPDAVVYVELRRLLLAADSRIGQALGECPESKSGAGVWEIR